MSTRPVSFTRPPRTSTVPSFFRYTLPPPAWMNTSPGAKPSGAAACDAAAPDAEEIASFIREHPLVWVPRLREKVAASQPEGYFVRLLDVALALLKRQA